MDRPHLIICDWDGTLSRGRFWSHLDDVFYQRIQQLFFKGERDRVREWMRGIIHTDEVVAWLDPQIGVPAGDLSRALATSCASIVIMDDLRSRLMELRESYRLALVTDNMDCFSRYIVPTIQDVFHEIVNSADVGRLKCEENGRTFQDVALRQECALDSSVLIDDSESTCAIFRSLGGTALRTSGPDETLCLLQQF